MVVKVLSLAVGGVRKSVNASYESLKEEVGVSVTSLYNKLLGTELAVSQALVRETAERAAPAGHDGDAAVEPEALQHRRGCLDGISHGVLLFHFANPVKSW